MSISLINAVMEGFAGGMSEKFVLVAFARHADAQGRCWPSQQLIADQVRLKRRQVINLIASLCRSGWLKVEHRGSGPGNSTRYRVVIPDKCATQCIFNGRSNMQPIAHLKRQRNVQSTTANVQSMASEMCNPLHTNMSRNQSLEGGGLLAKDFIKLQEESR